MKQTLIVLSFAALLSACTSRHELSNEYLAVTFTDQGVSLVKERQSNLSLPVVNDHFMLVIDGDTLNSTGMTPARVTRDKESRTEHYEEGGYRISVIYELKAGWRFVSKQLHITSDEKESFRVDQCNPWNMTLEHPVESKLDLSAGKYGFVVRFGAGDDERKPVRAGESAFFLIQNPYSSYAFENNQISAGYPAEMQWFTTDGDFPSDRACLGVQSLSGVTMRHDLLPEWSYVEDPDAFVTGGLQIDQAEIRAVTECARAFLMIDPTEAVKVHIGWCENDYQIDVATPEGREEYLRIIDQAAAVGCEHVLYTPNHSLYGPLENNRDAWGWENLLWLGLGQKVRTGEWVPGRDPLPADILGMIDYARDKGIKLMAYVYPSLPFMQDSAWTAWRTAIGQKPEHYLTVDTGLRSFQDWFVDLCIAFYEQTGISGYSFDHWWMAYTDEAGLVSSKYQQWFGTRRILEELRRRAPEIILDGRQQYHHFGTWTWLAGTYPHPMMSDEQPGSFNPFPGLSTDRISADRQRYVAHRLMVRDFTPMEVLPGFITHQTQRSDANRVMRRDSYRIRDWDFLGWEYNLLSTVATAPFNLVINYLPARDTSEFKHFSQRDKDFFKHWLQFCDDNLSLLRNIRPILGQPMVGRCDGTSAIEGDQGYIFLFNPNYEELTAGFYLNEDIGLLKGGPFLLKQLYPAPEAYLPNHENGQFGYGESVNIRMTGTSVRVLQLVPIEGEADPTLLFVQEPDADNPEVLLKLTREDGNRQSWELTISQQYLEKLASYREAWPIPYTPDDLEAPWVDPSRMLLFINIADPYREKVEEWKDGNGEIHTRNVREPMDVGELSLKVDGREVKIKGAYNGVYPYETRTFLGFYADLSHLQAGPAYSLDLTLPGDLRRGQFRGIYLKK